MLKMNRIFAFLCVLLIPGLSMANLELKDFEGSYIAYFYSTGGVGAGTLQPEIQVGNSISGVAQFQLDKCGNGTVNFVSRSTYTGPVGTPLIVGTFNGSPSTSPFSIQMTIVNPQTQTANVTISNFPTPGANANLDLVVRTSKVGRHKRKVEELYLNLVGYSGSLPFPPDSTGLIIAKRQQ